MQKYMNPPIPEGFVHVSGAWDKAFIIEDVKNKNRFTWIPLGICENFKEYFQSLLSGLDGYGTKYDFTKEMLETYEGIYVSTYLISRNSRGKFASVNGKAITDITFKLAKEKSANICKEIGTLPIRTRLMYGAEYDMVVKCIAKLSGKEEKTITEEQFEEYGLYGMCDIWTWTLTNHSEFAMILKRGDTRTEQDSVYANNEWFESPAVGIRAILILF